MCHERPADSGSPGSGINCNRVKLPETRVHWISAGTDSGESHSVPINLSYPPPVWW